VFVYVVHVVLAATVYPPSSEVMEIASPAIAGIIFLVLSFLLGLYSYRLLRVVDTIKVSVRLALGRSGPFTFSDQT